MWSQPMQPVCSCANLNQVAVYPGTIFGLLDIIPTSPTKHGLQNNRQLTNRGFTLTPARNSIPINGRLELVFGAPISDKVSVDCNIISFLRNDGTQFDPDYDGTTPCVHGACIGMCGGVGRGTYHWPQHRL